MDLVNVSDLQDVGTHGGQADPLGVAHMSTSRSFPVATVRWLCSCGDPAGVALPVCPNASDSTTRSGVG